MKRNITTSVVLAALAVITAGCAKAIDSATYENDKRVFEAWIQTHHSNAVKTGLGVYILPEDEVEGEGAEITDSAYIFAEYTLTDLEGTIQETTSEELAKQLGDYNLTYYYGPKILPFFDHSQNAGVEQAFAGMRIGGSRTAIVPRWLLSNKRYDSEDKYIADSDGGTADCIYSIHITDATNNIDRYELQLLREYSRTHLGGIDTLTTGFYYKRTAEPVDTTSFPQDTTIYINYTGRLLDGRVFDTTIKDTAKMYNLYNASASYGPKEVKWGETSAAITLAGSTVIPGFSQTLWQMRAMEKGIGVFYSTLGYGASGSGKSIPPYSPLIFEIEIVEAEK